MEELRISSSSLEWWMHAPHYSSSHIAASSHGSCWDACVIKRVLELFWAHGDLINHTFVQTKGNKVRVIFQHPFFMISHCFQTLIKRHKHLNICNNQTTTLMFPSISAVVFHRVRTCFRNILCRDTAFQQF